MKNLPFKTHIIIQKIKSLVNDFFSLPFKARKPHLTHYLIGWKVPQKTFSSSTLMVLLGETLEELRPLALFVTVDTTG